MILRRNNDSNDLKFDFPVFNGFGELLVGLNLVFQNFLPRLCD